MKNRLLNRKTKLIEIKLRLRHFRPTPGRIAILVIVLATGLYGVHVRRSIATTANAPQVLGLHVRSSPIATPAPSPSGFGIAVGSTAQSLTTPELNSEFADIRRIGFSWIRFDLQWETVQPSNSKTYDWSAYDRIVDLATKNGLHVLPTLAYAPKWARLTICNSTDKCAPSSPAKFAAFAQAAALHFKAAGVDDWEIWNEPNLQGFWLPAPSPMAYTALLKATYPAIKSVEPQATVITGGLGSLDQFSQSIDSLTFLNNLYADGAKNYFDAVGWHPYSYPATPDTVASWSGWSKMGDLGVSVRSIMAANGDGGKLIWMTEFGAPTGGPGSLATIYGYNQNGSEFHVSDTLQSEMATQAVNYVRSSSWAGPMFWYSYRDLGTNSDTNENFFGLVSFNGTKKPAYYTFENALVGH